MSLSSIKLADFERNIRKVEDDHWHWVGLKTKGGVGFVYVNRIPVRAYRVAWWFAKGADITDKGFIRTCSDSECINPDHFECVEVGHQLKGSHHTNAKLTEEDVVDILALAESGVTQVEISQRFGVSQPQISMIIRRKAWSHVG